MIPINDLQVLISPQFIYAVMYNIINSFNYIPSIDKVFDGSNSQVRVDEIIVWNNIEYTLQVYALENNTVRISLVDYTVAIKGKFTNTLFDYFFTLSCAFKDPK
jgi:hypothetical protein